MKEMAQRVDWSPRKQNKIVLLSEQGYSYEAVSYTHLDVYKRQLLDLRKMV